MDKGMDAEGEGRNRVLRPVPPISRTREEHCHHRACAARPQARTASLSPRPDRLRHDDHRGRRRDREQTADRAIGELAAEEPRGEERQTDPGHLAQGASLPVPSPQPRQAAFATRRVGVSVDSGRDHAALEGGCLLLTTRGRRSGRERTVVLQFFPGGNAMVVAAANGGGASHPGWYFNLKADPVARVEVMGRTIAVRAAELPADEAAAWWQRILRRDPSYERYPRGPAARSRSSAWSPPPRRAERVRKRPPKPRSSGASARDTMIVSFHVA